MNLDTIPQLPFEHICFYLIPEGIYESLANLRKPYNTNFDVELRIRNNLIPFTANHLALRPRIIITVYHGGFRNYFNG
ncbi:hypothetical protein PRIPAC_94848 [Pristionchus pacificus]|uniref:Uncharacterized protein n=1 Tax=Pristionchus pacificus TaxID=54126 RepID=A0A2A6BPE4_PRIPA|nr:hypothetical protein PRIPAC_94848 [Pristionchus pacificus]|eukprot:PDM67696.1 hypothetical protein PRIPAC_45740 [Pristionchus pacificus]